MVYKTPIRTPDHVVMPVVVSHHHIALNYVVSIGFAAFAVAAGIVTLVLQRPTTDRA